MKVYEVPINGVTHTLQLSDEDAKRLGVKEAPTPQNKQAHEPKNKGQ